MTGALSASLERLGQDLARAGVPWALIGGFAVSARAEPRFTRNEDACVVVDSDQAAEGLALTLTGWGYSVVAAMDHEYRDRLAAIRLDSPLVGGLIADLLFASSGVGVTPASATCRACFPSISPLASRESERAA
jgi:hypothetical protein